MPDFFFVCIYFSFTPTQDGWLKGVFVKTRQAPAALNRVGGKLNNGMADYRAGKLAAYVTQLDGFFLFVDVRRRLPHSKWQPKAHTEVPPEGQRKSLLMRFEVFGLTRGVPVLGPGAALALDSVTRQPIKVLMNTREWLVAPTRSRKHVKRYANTP